MNNHAEAIYEVELYNKSKGIIKYSLTNDFIEIMNAYIRQTGNSIRLTEELKWKSNKRLANDIRSLMNEYDVKYSMTYCMIEKYRYITFHKRDLDKWSSAYYSVIPSESEKQNYYRINYPFHFYTGFIKGFFQGMILAIKQKINNKSI